MTFRGKQKPGIAIALSAALVLLLIAACGSDPASTEALEAAPTSAPSSAQTFGPTPAPEATPTPTRQPTPTLTAEEQLSDLLSRVEWKLAAMSTATFDLVDVHESGAPFFRTNFKSLTGIVKSPHSFWMQVNVVAPGFGSLKIEMTAVGEEAYMKFSEDGPWTPLPLEQVPFNFGEIGLQLSRLVPALTDVSLLDSEAGEDVRIIGFEGLISSDELSGLITGVDPGHTVTLTFWVDEVEHTLRKFQIAGKLFNDDAPETMRLLDVTGVNIPVDIQLPEAATQE